MNFKSPRVDAKYEAVTVDTGYKIYMKLRIRNVTEDDFMEYRLVVVFFHSVLCQNYNKFLWHHMLRIFPIQPALLQFDASFAQNIQPIERTLSSLPEIHISQVHIICCIRSPYTCMFYCTRWRQIWHDNIVISRNAVPALMLAKKIIQKSHSP